MDGIKVSAFRWVPPFAQGLVLFESGSIVLHIAEQSDALMPAGASDRARVRTWMFAALSTVEPPTMMLNTIDMQPAAAREAAQELRATVVKRVQSRLDGVADFLGQRDYLVADRFTAADLLLTTVLRALRTTDMVRQMPALEAYRLRCEARPAFQRALADQMATFAENAPKS